MRVAELSKYYCMSCKSSQWMRMERDPDGMGDGMAWKCIICGTMHRHPHLWRKPPRTER